MLWLILGTYNIILNSNVTSQKNEGLFFKPAFHNLKCNLLVYMMPASSDMDVDDINITISVTKIYSKYISSHKRRQFFWELANCIAAVNLVLQCWYTKTQNWERNTNLGTTRKQADSCFWKYILVFRWHIGFSVSILWNGISQIMIKETGAICLRQNNLPNVLK